MSFTTTRIVGSSANPEFLYYNATIVNNTIDTNQASDDPIVRFQDTRETPLIKDISNYNIGVESFNLDGATKSLPLFIPQIQPTADIEVSVITDVSYPIAGTIQYDCYTDPTTLLSLGNRITIQGLYPASLNFSNVVITGISSTYIQIAGTIAGSPSIGPNSVGLITKFNANNINTTIYSVSFAMYNGHGYYLDEQFVEWEPENKTIFTIIPTTANPTQQETDYYYLYSYSHWVHLLNEALRKAYTNVKAALTAQPSRDSQNKFGTTCPFFEFNEQTGLFTLNQDVKTSICPVGIELSAPYSIKFTATGDYQAGEYSFCGMNSNMEGLMTNFMSSYYADGVYWKGITTNWQLPENVFDFGLTNLDNSATTNGDEAVGTSLRYKPEQSTFHLVNPFDLTNINTAHYVRMTQDFISTGTLWSPIASFVMATTQIPVRTEVNANPILLGSKNIGLSNGVSGSFQKVLIETPYEQLTADVMRGWVLYEPKIPTFSSLDPSQESIYNIDVQFYWRNRLTNALIPLRLYNTGTINFRLIFQRK